MDQVDYLRRAAEAERLAGREASALELSGIADELELRAAEEPELRAVLLAAARRRKQGKRARGAGEPAQVFMPGALPAAALRSVSREVASIFHAHGDELFKGALEDLRASFGQRYTATCEKLKAALRDQYGAAGLAQHLPLFGEWRDAILANLAEYGADEIRRMEHYAPAGAPGGPEGGEPPAAPENAPGGAPTQPAGS